MRKGEFTPFRLDTMVAGFQRKIGNTEYMKPVDDIIEAFRLAMKRELGVELKIEQKEPRRKY